MEMYKGVIYLEENYKYYFVSGLRSCKNFVNSQCKEEGKMHDLELLELRLYKFFSKNDIDLDWRDESLLAWIWHSSLEDFINIIGRDYFEGDYVQVNLQPEFVVIDLVPICKDLGINLENILEKE
jgi:hypothetical protein